jgi:hypothetical protein
MIFSAFAVKKGAGLQKKSFLKSAGCGTGLKIKKPAQQPLKNKKEKKPAQRRRLKNNN